jgi:hypothetical protein
MLFAAIANVARNTGTTEAAARALLAKGSPTVHSSRWASGGQGRLAVLSRSIGDDRLRRDVWRRRRRSVVIANPQHFAWRVDGRVATITLNRPERKNPLTSIRTLS